MNRGLLKGLNFFIDPRAQSLLLTGLYEREILSAVGRFAARARTAVDVGASDGLSTPSISPRNPESRRYSRASPTWTACACSNEISR